MKRQFMSFDKQTTTYQNNGILMLKKKSM